MLLGTYNIACAEDSNVAIDDSKASESQNQEIKGNKDVLKRLYNVWIKRIISLQLYI